MVSNDMKSFEVLLDNIVAPSNKIAANPGKWNVDAYNPAVVQNKQVSSMAYVNPLCAGDFKNTFPMMQAPDSSKPIWYKSSGDNWQASLQKRTYLEGNDFRPAVQSRYPQLQQRVQYQQQQLPAIPLEASSPLNSPPVVSDNPNQIQNFVSELIRQNSLKKSYNLPSWVDVSKPPPPLPDLTSINSMQYNPKMQNYSSDDHFSTKLSNSIQKTNFLNMHNFNAESVDHSMIVKPAMMSGTNASDIDQKTEPLSQANISASTNLLQSEHSTRGNISQAAAFLQSDASPQTTNSRYSCEEVDPPMQNTVVNGVPELSGETDNGLKRDDYMKSYKAAQAALSEISANSASVTKKLPRLATSRDAVKPSDYKHSIKHETTCEDTNSTAPLKSRPNTVHFLGGDISKDFEQQHESVKLFSKKPSYNRQPSAADLDMNWRRRDSQEDKEQDQNTDRRARHSSFENRGNRGFSREGSGDGKEIASVFQSTSSGERSNTTFHNRTETLPTDDISNHDSIGRHVTQKSKVKLLSWIQQNDEMNVDDCVGKEIRQLQISESETDLSKFIAVTQSFATNEAKMREVAEILFNKALNNNNLCRNISILCDRLSFMMVHGTKFRNVILNVLQVLSSEEITQEHVECFTQLFKKVGPVLELESPSRLDQIMSEIRDRLVVSKPVFVKRALLYCVEYYASKWDTVS